MTQRALQLIDARACEPRIRLAQIAAALHRSESRVSHLLTSETGRTFPEHVEAVRLKEVMVLLRERDLSIKEAGALVGWCSSELVRHFKRAMEMSPGRWRTREWARRQRPPRPKKEAKT